MTSNANASVQAATEAFVWIWWPGALEPVVAGRIERDGSTHVFTYGRSYLERKEAIPIFAPELDLRRGPILPNPPLDMAGCLRDGAPDAWGRRVIINRLTGLRGQALQEVEFDELTFLLNSASDRIRALDFQLLPDHYVPREQENEVLHVEQARRLLARA